MNSFFVILAILFAITNTQAASLSGRSSDDTVCDLTPSTSYNLTKRVLFVEAGPRDEHEIYTRIALRFIIANCRNGQTLLMHSDFGDSLDDRFFREVAIQVCGAGRVQRESAATTEAPQSFQVRCPISRMFDAKNYLSESEKRKSTETMIAEGVPSHGQQDSKMGEQEKKCDGKLSFGQVMLGLGGRCKR